jgi:hypothetical protein
MMQSDDMRVPVLAGRAEQAAATDVVQPLLSATVSGGHAFGCACCQPRGPLAAALAGLFTDRARGRVPYFARVIVPCAPADEPALAAALLADPVTAARFRFAGRLGA